ncbi:MAG TPA: MFS transporter [Ornithinicoccus sp.]|nr:MFS transporter [Ornithinicoccus sp.]
MSATRPASDVDVVAVQRRTIRTLVSGQVLGGIGVASGIAVGALLAAETSGQDSLSGLASTTQVLGAALMTAPIAAIMAAHGRRPGLVTAYAVGTVGAALAVLAAMVGSFPLLLVGTALFGASTTANSQSRYAATDLAPLDRKGSSLSLVVWATTIGSVLGPNMVGPGAWVARQLGLPELSGALLFSAVGFVVAAVVLQARLRPDPLVLARELVGHGPAVRARGSVLHGIRVIRRTPAALLGTVTITVGHAVMVAVMVMTPLHMSHGHAEVELIGLVISIHILGMFGLSPVTGHLTDRFGARPVVLTGVVILLAACSLAGVSAQGSSWTLTAGLFLLGLGWSCTMVAGSGLVAGALEVEDRSAGQGASDIVMGLGAAAAGALAGVVVGLWGYSWLCLAAGVLALALGASTARARSVVSLNG